MIRQPFTGGWYTDARPNGAYVSVIRDSHITHNGGWVELPSPKNNILQVRLSLNGSRFAGGAHIGFNAFEWDGTRFLDRGVAFGPRSCMYDQNDQLMVVRAAGSYTGSIGWRYVDDNGIPIASWETYNPTVPMAVQRKLPPNFWEWSEHDGIIIGQGDGGVDAIVQSTRRRYKLAGGATTFINWYKVGNDMSAGWVDESNGTGQAMWFSVNDLIALPSTPVDQITVTVPPLPPPVVVPPPPVEGPKMAGNPLKSSVVGLINRFAQKFPLPQGSPGDDHENNCRAWMQTLEEQIEFTFPGEGYGRKRGDPGRPWSKDNLPRKTAQGLEGWDLMAGAGTGKPRLEISAVSISLDGQDFQTVSPVDHLDGRDSQQPPAGGTGTTPPPVQVPQAVDLSPVTARLDLLAERLSDLEANQRILVLQVTKLAGRPDAGPVVFPAYTGALGMRVRLVPEKI